MYVWRCWHRAKYKEEQQGYLEWGGGGWRLSIHGLCWPAATAWVRLTANKTYFWGSLFHWKLLIIIENCKLYSPDHVQSECFICNICVQVWNDPQAKCGNRRRVFWPQWERPLLHVLWSPAGPVFSFLLLSSNSAECHF